MSGRRVALADNLMCSKILPNMNCSLLVRRCQLPSNEEVRSINSLKIVCYFIFLEIMQNSWENTVLITFTHSFKILTSLYYKTDASKFHLFRVVLHL